jgi:hypothetical protein
MVRPKLDGQWKNKRFNRAKPLLFNDLIERLMERVRHLDCSLPKGFTPIVRAHLQGHRGAWIGPLAQVPTV